jgi:subtilisin family serine protease
MSTPLQRPAWSRGDSIFDPAARLLESLPLTAEWAWGGATGRGVRVAVLDSGVQSDHPALQGCVDEADGIALHLSDAGEVIEEPGPHEDLFGHGTACAAIIHSIAPEVRITSVRVLGATLTGRGKVFLRALAWAVEEGYDVINLSLTTAKRDWALPFYEVCDRAYFRGCFVVTSANNFPVVSFPSLYSSVASVACNVATDPFEFHVNPDPPVEFLAPGIDIEVAWRGSLTMRATGNSFAAPHISGIAALICGKHPGLRPPEIKSVLLATAANAPMSGASGSRGTLDSVPRDGVSARARSAIMPAVVPPRL